MEEGEHSAGVLGQRASDMPTEGDASVEKYRGGGLRFGRCYELMKARLDGRSRRRRLVCGESTA